MLNLRALSQLECCCPYKFRPCFLQIDRLLLDRGVDLSDVSSRKPDNNGISLVGLVRRDKDMHTSRLGLGKRLREIRHFISGHLAPVGIWKVAVSNERSQLSKL